MFACRPVELDFIRQAPLRFENVVDLDATPEHVFDVFADGESWPKWFPGIRRVVWTGPEPKAAGTTRTVTLGLATVSEYFLVWERGKRFTFRFSGVSKPLFRAGIEDYRLDDLGDGRTRFTYGVYLEPSLLVSALSPITTRMFGRTFEGGALGLRAFLARR